MSNSFSNRRRFIADSAFGAMGASTLVSSMANLELIGSLAAAELGPAEDYKALVCVFLAGGNDSFNMLAPTEGDARIGYELARGGAGLPVSDFVNLPEVLPDGRQLGLHRSMPELHELYNSGNAAFVSNVGTLLEPTDLDSLNSGASRLPLGLFSHSDQQIAWQSGLPGRRSARSGVAGRIADVLDSLNGESNIAMNISIAGNRLFNVSETTPARSLSIGASGISRFSIWNSGSLAAQRVASETMMDLEGYSVFQEAYIDKKRSAIAVGAEYGQALSNQSLETSFTNGNSLSQQLREVARIIGGRNALNKRRQTFFVQMNGWDLHGGLASAHPSLLASLSQAIGEFQDAMTELGTTDDVTLFSASDFGRTLTFNGAGTDHGWGGNQFVVGGAVNGTEASVGEVYGSYPDLALGSALDAGEGRLIPSTSVDEYYADLALWMGVPGGSLSTVLPNLWRFHDVTLDGAPLGIMG